MRRVNAAGSAVEQLREIRGYVGIGYVFGFAASLLFRWEEAGSTAKIPLLSVPSEKNNVTINILESRAACCWHWCTLQGTLQEDTSVLET